LGIREVSVVSEFCVYRLPLQFSFSIVLAAIHEKLEAMAADITAWESVSINTAFEDVVMSPIGGKNLHESARRYMVLAHWQPVYYR
jgi:hypothetical protein